MTVGQWDSRTLERFEAKKVGREEGKIAALQEAGKAVDPGASVSHLTLQTSHLSAAPIASL